MDATKTRNPNWSRDEIILALNLYFELNGKDEVPNNQSVIDLSATLNRLSNLENRSTTFRNPDGVAMKLQNLRYFDTGRTGGLPAGSKLDEKAFREFYNDRPTLRAIAEQIISSLNLAIDPIPDIDEDASAREGKRLQKIHYSIERSRRIVEKKKKAVLQKEGRLSCEVCSFDFQTFYGFIGEGFIECHHKVPLAKLSSSMMTKLSDLALVCSNCHRMLHKDSGITIESLKSIIINTI
jgi:5-methylcytosine-specific restriction enzyme A